MLTASAGAGHLETCKRPIAERRGHRRCTGRNTAGAGARGPRSSSPRRKSRSKRSRRAMPRRTATSASPIADVFDDLHPLVQDAYRLLRGVNDIRQSIDLLFARNDFNAVASIEARLRQAFNSVDSASAQLASRGNADAEPTQIRQKFAELEPAVLGDNGARRQPPQHPDGPGRPHPRAPKLRPGSCTYPRHPCPGQTGGSGNADSSARSRAMNGIAFAQSTVAT